MDLRTRRPVRRKSGAALCALGLSLWAFPGQVSAEPSDEAVECLEAYEQTQEARQAGNLLRARALSESCVKESCHEVMRESCVAWQAELAQEIPSIRLRVLDSSGKAVAGITVILDRNETLSGAGRRIELDPGTHSLEVSAAGFEPAQTTFELSPGQQDLELSLTLTAVVVENEKAPEPEPAPRPPLWPAYVAGGVSVAGFSVLAVFGSQARAKDRDLEDCSVDRTCSESDVDAVKSNYTVANIGLAVGVAGAATAIGWTVYALSRKTRSDNALNLTLRPDAVSLSGSF